MPARGTGQNDRRILAENSGGDLMKPLTKKIGIVSDILMFAAMLTQMLYVFTGNLIHEITGVVFFVCLVIHLVIKRKWIKALLTGKLRCPGGTQKLSVIVTCLLMGCCVMMMLSSMGVSRTLFPWFRALGSSDLHRYLASAMLGLAAVHGCLKHYQRTKKKKKAAVLMVLAGLAGMSIGLFGVPYINRHFRTVEINYTSAVTGEKAVWKGSKPLVVYFTRVGNTDFEANVDAVSGASLLLADGELMGNDQLLADMIEDITGCDKRAVVLKGKKYPSGYNDTVMQASKELSSDARPDIEPIDVSGYDSIILIYPLWWGTVPPPVATFLESSDLSGKTIYLIATQGSSGFSDSTEDIKKYASGAEVIEVMSIYCDDIPEARPQLLDWVKKMNAKTTSN